MGYHTTWNYCALHVTRDGAVGCGTALQDRKVAVSIPECVIGIFHWHNPSGRSVALGLIQPLTKISTRNISFGGKGGRCVGWQPYHFYVPTVLKYGSVKFLEPSGPVQACNGIAFLHKTNLLNFM